MGSTWGPPRWIWPYLQPNVTTWFQFRPNRVQPCNLGPNPTRSSWVEHWPTWPTQCNMLKAKFGPSRLPSRSVFSPHPQLPNSSTSNSRALYRAGHDLCVKMNSLYFWEEAAHQYPKPLFFPLLFVHHLAIQCHACFEDFPPGIRTSFELRRQSRWYFKFGPMGSHVCSCFWHSSPASKMFPKELNNACHHNIDAWRIQVST